MKSSVFLKWVLGSLLFLTACASSMPETSIGPLRLQIERPDEQPKAQIIAVHGFNDYHIAFRFLAPYARDKKIKFISYDQRGFGKSPYPGTWPGHQVLIDDLTTLIRKASSDEPDIPLFLLGESMGAAVAIAALASFEEEDPPVAGLIMTSPAVWGGRSFNPFLRGVLWMASTFTPRGTLSGRRLGIQASDNVEELIKMGKDPFFIKETRFDSMQGVVNLMDLARSRAADLRLPILILLGANDEVIPPDAIHSFVAELNSDDCRAITYTNGWHYLLRDHQRMRVFDDILAWIDHRKPLSSAALC